MAVTKIQATKNYRLFHRHDDENRPFNLASRATLRASMKKYGFLRCYPIICHRDSDGKLKTKDGQHRLAIAEELGLTVYWIETEEDFDVAVVNSAVKGWSNKDYALKWAAQGVADYEVLVEFADRYRVPHSFSAALLAGTTAFANVRAAFYDGNFKVKDRKWAESVASLYSQVGCIGPAVRDQRFLQACMAVCRLKDFETSRLVSGAERCREKLIKYGTREGCLDMIEDIYNFGRSKRVAVKVPALNAMRDRNPGLKKRAKKEEKAA